MILVETGPIQLPPPNRPAPLAEREGDRVAPGVAPSGLEAGPATPLAARVLESQLAAAAQDDGAGTGPNELSPEETEVVDKLRARDREVKTHEEAHARVGGKYAGSPSYTYQTGPDGKTYAIGGQVPIDVAPVPDDPEATIVKMDVVKAAALAPAEPSGQDRAVAALADANRLQAIADLAVLRRQTEPVPEPTLDKVA